MFFSLPPRKLAEKEERRKLFRHILKRVFVDDWVMKLVALVITLTLWLGVTGLEAPTTTRIRGVTLQPLIANDLEDVTSAPVREVDLVVKGPKQKLDQILPRDLAVSLDLNDIGPGDRTVQITPQNISVDLPSGVEVVEVRPNKIAVKLEKVTESVVPVKVEIDGTPADGYEVYGSTSIPETVRVRGPESFVDSLSYVSTERVIVSGATSTITVPQVPLNILNPKISLVSAATANVTVRIGKKRIERLIVVPYETENRKGRASILLFGPSDVLESLSPNQISIVEESGENAPSKLKVVLPPAMRDSVEIRGEPKFRE